MKRILMAAMLGLATTAAVTVPTASASEDEVQALVRENHQNLSDADAYGEPGKLSKKGTLASGDVVYIVKGTQVYFTARGSSNYVLATRGEYDLGDERYLLIGREGQVLNANLNPFEDPDNLRFLRKRPGRVKAR